MSLQIDLWTSRDVRTYLGMVLSATDENLIVQHFKLPVVRIKREEDGGASGLVIAREIRKIFFDFDDRAALPRGTPLGRITWITTDGSGKSNNLSCACRELGKYRISCAAHLIQSALKDFAAADELFLCALVLARCIAGKLRKNTKIRASVAKIVSFTPTRFDSMLACLDSVSRYQDALLSKKDSLLENCASDFQRFARSARTQSFSSG